MRVSAGSAVCGVQKERGTLLPCVVACPRLALIAYLPALLLTTVPPLPTLLAW